MKLRQLEAMRAVLTRGTTTHAGELIGLTQSAVSRLIKQLEDELGFKLFDRRHGRLLITPEGQHFYVIAEKVLAGIDQINSTARDITTLGTGTIKIIAMPALGYGLLPDTIGTIKSRYKRIKILIDSGSRHQIEQGVSSANYDFGLATLPIEHEAIDTDIGLQIIDVRNGCFVDRPGPAHNHRCQDRTHHRQDVPQRRLVPRAGQQPRYRRGELLPGHRSPAGDSGGIGV